MPFDLNMFLKAQDLRDLTRMQMHMIVSLRLCAIGRKNGADIFEMMTLRFGGTAPAKAMLSLASVLGDAWPESFTISRPCCAMVTPDEMLAAQMLRHVQAGDRGGFAATCGEMIPPVKHDDIFAAMAYFAGELSATMAARING